MIFMLKAVNVNFDYFQREDRMKKALCKIIPILKSPEKSNSFEKMKREIEKKRE